MLEISSNSIKPDAAISFMRINQYRSKRVKMIYSSNFEWNSMTQGITRLTKSRCRYLELEKLDRDSLRSRTTGVDIRSEDCLQHLISIRRFDNENSCGWILLPFSEREAG